jgi:hypothetical protein
MPKGKSAASTGRSQRRITALPLTPVLAEPKLAFSDAAAGTTTAGSTPATAYASTGASAPG